MNLLSILSNTTSTRVLFGAFMSASIVLSSAVVAQDDPTAAKLREQYLEKTFVDAQAAEHKYRLLLPAGFREGDATRYPLILFLHGAGERGSDNALQLKHGAVEFMRADRQAAYPCFVVMPQCPNDEKWVSVDWAPVSGKGTFPDEPAPAMKVAMGIVNQWIKSGRVDPSRVYITGLSMGGYGTWFATAVRNNPFAAAVPICGGGDPTWANRYDSMPIWNFHGSADTAVPVGRSREMIEALTEAKHQPEAKYTEYEGGGHDVWTETYKRDDLWAWLFSQSK